MSEAADELERMADELKRLSTEASDLRLAATDLFDKLAHATAMAAYSDAAGRLRARAAELRAQGAGLPPKPREVKAGQWWSFRECDPERVSLRDDDGRVFFNDIDWEYTPEADLLTSDLFSYRGDGDAPVPHQNA